MSFSVAVAAGVLDNQVDLIAAPAPPPPLAKRPQKERRVSQRV